MKSSRQMVHDCEGKTRVRGAPVGVGYGEEEEEEEGGECWRAGAEWIAAEGDGAVGGRRKKAEGRGR